MSKTVEEKRAKFIALATERANRIENAVRIFGNLCNLYAYDYDQSMVIAMFKNLRKMLDTVEAQFVNALKAKGAWKDE